MPERHYVSACLDLKDKAARKKAARCYAHAKAGEEYAEHAMEQQNKEREAEREAMIREREAMIRKQHQEKQRLPSDP